MKKYHHLAGPLLYFSCEYEQPEPLPVVESEIGIDLGVTHFAALSDGTFIDNPRHYRQSQKKLEKLQQALSRKKQGSHRRDKARKLVAKTHRKIRNQRRDFQHKHSTNRSGVPRLLSVGRNERSFWGVMGVGYNPSRACTS